jgi:hypothetical protein
MSHHTVDVTRWSAAAPGAVWRWLADASSWRAWTRLTDTRLERSGSPEPDGVGALRRFGLLGGSSLEEVVVFDPPRHLAYVLRRGLPITNYRADVTLHPDGDGTRIRWRGEFDTRYPGTGPVMAAFLRAMLSGFATSLARHAAAAE